MPREPILSGDDIPPPDGDYLSSKVNVAKLRDDEVALRPRHMSEILKDEKHIAHVAREIANARDVLYLGRGINYPIALEGGENDLCRGREPADVERPLQAGVHAILPTGAGTVRVGFGGSRPDEGRFDVAIAHGEAQRMLNDAGLHIAEA